jgi:hypothetical protein
MGYPNLPGVTVQLNDLGLKIAPPPAGPKVTLIGICSNTGIPLNEPFSVTNVGQATAALYFSGDSAPATRTRPSDLALAIEEAISAGAPNVEIVVSKHVNGAGLTGYIGAHSNLSGYYAALSGTYDAIMNTNLDMVVPVGAYADDRQNDFAQQLANFCWQATTEVDNACHGVIGMMPVVKWALHQRVALTGAAAAAALNTEVAAYTTGADERFALPSLALVTQWAKYASQYNGPNVGTTDLSTTWGNYLKGSEDAQGLYSPINDENGADEVNPSYWTSWQAQALDGSYVTDQKGNKSDVGSRISVVGAPLVTVSKQIRELAIGLGASVNQTSYATDGAAAYAGFTSSKAPQSSPTNKRITNLNLQRSLSPAQANKIAGRRIVTFHNRANGFVVANAMTGAHNVSKYVRSDYVRLTTVRVVDSIVDLIRAVSEKYIGEPNTAAQRNALGNEIDKFLKQMRVANAINGYKFFLSATPDQQVLGEATIDLTIVPPFEILKITTNISLAKTVSAN